MKIIFGGNFFRFSEGSHLPLDILYELLAPIIGKSHGVNIEYIFPNKEDIHNYKKLEKNFANVEYMFTNWSKYQEDNVVLPDDLLDGIYTDADCVIGFEISPSICNLLTRKKQKYINFFIHPVRFCKDIFFEVTTNDSNIASRLANWQLDYNKQARTEADKVRTYTVPIRMQQKCIQPNTVAVFMQTRGDASVIANGEFVSLFDFAERVTALAKDYDEVILAKHPYEEISTELLAMVSDSTSIVETNSYALLCNSNIKKVVTISSSIGSEAKFFGKETEFLLGESLRKGGALVTKDAYCFAAGQVILQKEFWEDVLLGHKNHIYTDINHFAEPDIFRRLFSSWAYEEINPRDYGRGQMGCQKLNLQSLKEATGQIMLNGDDAKTAASLVEGFSQAEPDGRWTDGKHAKFWLYLGENEKGIDIKINCAYIDNLVKEQLIEVKVDKISVGKVIIQDANTYILRIPIRKIGISIIEIELPNASSPAAVGSMDPRILGIKIGYIAITKVACAEPLFLICDDILTCKNYSLDSGERQVADSIDGIRYDHRVRYELAAGFLHDKFAHLNKIVYGADIFCGNGYGSSIIANKNINTHILAIDGSEEAIDLAQRCYGIGDRIDFRHSLFPFDIGENKFDYFISLESIEHVEDDELFLSSITKAVKDGGYILLSTPNEEQNSLQLNRNDFHYRHYTDTNFTKMLNLHGIKVIAKYGQDVYRIEQGNIVGVLDDEKMELVENYKGQFMIYVCIVKTYKYPKWLVNLICLFVLKKANRKYIREKYARI